MARGHGAQQVPRGHLGASGASSLRAPLVLLLLQITKIHQWKALDETMDLGLGAPSKGRERLNKTKPQGLPRTKYQGQS